MVNIAIPPVRVIVCSEPEFTLYVTTAPAVPVRLKTASSPAQSGLLSPEIFAVGSGLTVIVPDAQFVVLHVLSARTKYVVVVVGFTVIELPDPTKVPPHEPEYQFHDAPVPSDPPETVNVVAVPLQIGVVPVMDVGAVEAVGCALIVTLADEAEVQPVATE